MYKGVLTDIREDGTAVIEAKLDTGMLIHRKVKEVYIDPIDSRPLSDKQRRMCYALINAIAEWSGSDTEEVKEVFKLDFWAERIDTLSDKVFSLANAPMSLVAEFQRFLVAFILTHDVPTKRPLREYVDDIETYTYLCVVRRKCAVCGRHAELHHVDAVGMGNDRGEVQHFGREVISLCREHHTEMHALGKQAFCEKYHLDGGVECDKTILKVYGLKQ